MWVLLRELPPHRVSLCVPVNWNLVLCPWRTTWNLSVFCFQGEWVWVDSSIGVPIGARVKVTPSGQRLLVDDEGKVNSAFALSQGKSQTSQNGNSWCYVAECIPVFTLPQERRLSPEQEASLKIMHPTSVEGVDDMIKLGDMTEAGLLRNLLLRHRQGIIYVSNTLKEKMIFVASVPTCFGRLYFKSSIFIFTVIV